MRMKIFFIILFCNFLTGVFAENSIEDELVQLQSLGDTYLQNQNFSLAIETMNEKISLISNIEGISSNYSMLAYITKGVAHHFLKEYDQAIEAYKNALNNSEDAAESRVSVSKIYSLIGKEYLETNRKTEARDCFQESIELFKSNGNNYIDLIEYYYFTSLTYDPYEEYQEVYEILKEAESLIIENEIEDNKNIGIYINLFTIELRREKPDAALESIHKAIAQMKKADKSYPEITVQSLGSIRRFALLGYLEQAVLLSESTDSYLKDYSEDYRILVGFYMELGKIFSSVDQQEIGSNYISKAYDIISAHPEN